MDIEMAAPVASLTVLYNLHIETVPRFGNDRISLCDIDHSIILQLWLIISGVDI